MNDDIKLDGLLDFGVMDALDKIFYYASDMLCILDDKGFFVKTNPKWTEELGWTEKELCSVPWKDFVHLDDLIPTMDIYARAVAGETIVNFKNRYRCKDGSFKVLHWQPVGFVGTQTFSIAKIRKD